MGYVTEGKDSTCDSPEHLRQPGLNLPRKAQNTYEERNDPYLVVKDAENPVSSAVSRHCFVWRGSKGTAKKMPEG